MKFNLLCILATLSPQFICAQANVYNVKEYMSLTEEVHLIRVFVDTPNGIWEDDEMEAYDVKLGYSLDWLANQAADYGEEVYFDFSKFDFLDDLVEVNAGGYGTTRGLRNLVIRKLGYDNVDDLLDAFNFDLDNNKLKMILLVKSNSRSHAYNYWSVKGLDCAMIYCVSTIGMVTTKYVMSHEILHLFGAWDLYKGERQNAEKAAALRIKYPHSVMINTWRNGELNNVDELTAWRVGWAPFKEEFMKYKPVFEEKKEGKTKFEFDLKRKKKKKG